MVFRLYYSEFCNGVFFVCVSICVYSGVCMGPFTQAGVCVKAEDDPGVIPRGPCTMFSCISFLQGMLTFLIKNISEIIISLRHFLSCTPLMQSSFSLKFMVSSFHCYRYSYILAYQHSQTPKENLLCWYDII